MARLPHGKLSLLSAWKHFLSILLLLCLVECHVCQIKLWPFFHPITWCLSLSSTSCNCTSIENFNRQTFLRYLKWENLQFSKQKLLFFVKRKGISLTFGWAALNSCWKTFSGWALCSWGDWENSCKPSGQGESCLCIDCNAYYDPQWFPLLTTLQLTGEGEGTCYESNPFSVRLVLSAILAVCALLRRRRGEVLRGREAKEVWTLILSLSLHYNNIPGI